MAAIEATGVKTIFGMKEAATSLDRSNQGLTPCDMKILAAHISMSPFTAGIAEVRLDGNLITGSKYTYAKKKYGVEEYDCDPSGFVALLESMKLSAVSKLSIADCGIGPKGLMAAAPAMRAIAGLSEVSRTCRFEQQSTA